MCVHTHTYVYTTGCEGRVVRSVVKITTRDIEACFLPCDATVSATGMLRTADSIRGVATQRNLMIHQYNTITTITTTTTTIRNNINNASNIHTHKHTHMYIYIYIYIYIPSPAG